MNRYDKTKRKGKQLPSITLKLFQNDLHVLTSVTLLIKPGTFLMTVNVLKHRRAPFMSITLHHHDLCLWARHKSHSQESPCEWRWATMYQLDPAMLDLYSQ